MPDSPSLPSPGSERPVASRWQGLVLAACGALALHASVFAAWRSEPALPHAELGAVSAEPEAARARVYLREQPALAEPASSQALQPVKSGLRGHVEQAHGSAPRTNVKAQADTKPEAVEADASAMQLADSTMAAAADEAASAKPMPVSDLPPALDEPEDEAEPMLVAAADLEPARPGPALAPRAYPTKVTPSFAFRYAMKRGQIGGKGELRFTRDADHYQAQLRGTVGGLTILSWTSTGGFDSAGIAPERYVDQRLARSPKAANFQRDAGKITYSGSTREFPVAPGAQDRLSWMLQLPAILDADHAKAREGSRIAMAVTGASADAEDYVFRCVGTQTVQTSSGPVQALKWVREPRREGDDNTVEVWLDPARAYLPVQARLSSSPSDTPLELLLEGPAN